jgi:hypothetical protein
MPIIISKNGKDAEKVEQSSFGLEDNLQQYIYDNPGSIPLYDIDEDTRLFIAAREFGTRSGPIDALGFDSSGNIYVVETKLYKNPDKRTVVAQALDYGASLWRNATSFDDFLLQLSNHTEKQFGMGFQEKYADFFELDDATENIQNIRANLADGVIKFVVLMDKLHEALKDLVIFVNQNSKFDLYAVELEYYKHAEFEIVIPKLFGAEVKKEVASSRNKSGQKYMTPSNLDDFWESVGNYYQQGEFGDIANESIRTLVSLYTDLVKLTGGTITYWRAVTSLGRDVVKFIVNDTNNKVSLYMDSDSSFGAYTYNKSGPQIDFVKNILERLVEQNIMKKTEKNLQNTQWFVTLKKTYTSDEEVQTFVDITRQAYELISSNN